MCGRFSLTESRENIEERFQAKFFDSDFQPRYNAAPGQMLPVILNNETNKIIYAKWGLLPPWLEEKRNAGLINSRAETLLEKPTFSKSFQTRCCLVIADGFYEWQKIKGNKNPFYFSLNNHHLFAFAGIWENNKNNIPTFSIITAPAAKMLAAIHDRMPVILNKDQEQIWLRPSDNLIIIQKLLLTDRTNEMQMWPVNKEINSPKIDKPELIRKA